MADFKAKRKFKNLYCPKCCRNTKHVKIDIGITRNYHFVFEGWECKKCGEVVQNQKN